MFLLSLLSLQSSGARVDCAGTALRGAHDGRRGVRGAGAHHAPPARARAGARGTASRRHESIKPYLIEEAYEVVEAIDARDDARAVRRARRSAAADRLPCRDGRGDRALRHRRRHPRHQREDGAPPSARVRRHAGQRRRRRGAQLVAHQVRGAPGQRRLVRAGRRAARDAGAAARAAPGREGRRTPGFDWADASGVLAKLREELDELDAAVASGDRAAARPSSAICCSRRRRWRAISTASAEDALKGAADRFRAPLPPHGGGARGAAARHPQRNAEELDALWEDAKRQDVGDQADLQSPWSASRRAPRSPFADAERRHPVRHDVTCRSASQVAESFLTSRRSARDLGPADGQRGDGEGQPARRR